MPDDLRATIMATLARAPQWLRHDLQSADASARERAEEALAAMIEQAIATEAAAPSCDHDAGA